MYLKRYTIGSVIFMLFIGWYISQFLGFSQTESISLFGLPLPYLPVAVLVLIPVVILYLMSVLHMTYYSVKSYFKLRNYQKDYSMLVDMIMDELLNKSHHYNFKTEPYKLLAKVLENTTMSIDDNIELTDNEKVNNIMKMLNEIKEGKVVDLKKFNLASDNSLVLQNQKNRMLNADLSAEAILAKSDKYSTEILEKAYADYAATAPMYALEKYQDYITKDALFIIIARVNSDENTLEVSNEALLGLINRLVLTREDFLSISKELSIHMVPEQRMKLFETLSEQLEEAQDAFLYTLLDLEMIEQAKEFLESVPADDMLKFRAYLALKESGQNYSIHLFI